MTTLNDLSLEDKQSLLAQAQAEVVAQLAPAGGSGGENYEQRIARLRKDLNLSAFAELTDVDAVRDALQKNMEEVLTAELARVDEYANRRLAQMMAERRKGLHIAEFAAEVTGGTEKLPYGLPVGREEIETFLSQLDDSQRTAAESILRRAWEKPRLDFRELGHGREVQSGRELPAEYAEALDSGTMKLADLKQPMFEAELGNLSGYNLSKWQNGGNK